MTVHIVASCTDRKRAPVRQDLRLRAFPEGKLEERARRWKAELAASAAQTQAARDLYGGEHWKLVLDLEDQIRQHGDVQLSVASAGYGLVDADAAIKPYSATFATGEPDSVVRGPGDEASDWWDALCGSDPTRTTLQDLTRGADALVVIASAKYLRAMLPDILRARTALPSPARLVVFSGSTVKELGRALVRVDARVQVALKRAGSDTLRGTKQGLAARTAKELLARTDTWPPEAPTLQAAYKELVAGFEAPAKLDRERHADEAVLDFIRSSLADNPRAGWTNLLRAWRGSGQACEQKRFRKLYYSVREERS